MVSAHKTYMAIAHGLYLPILKTKDNLMDQLATLMPYIYGFLVLIIVMFVKSIFAR